MQKCSSREREIKKERDRETWGSTTFEKNSIQFKSCHNPGQLLAI